VQLSGYVIVTRFGRPYYGYGERFSVLPDAERARRLCEGCKAGADAAGLGPLQVRPVRVEIMPEEAQRD